MARLHFRRQWRARRDAADGDAPTKLRGQNSAPSLTAYGRPSASRRREGGGNPRWKQHAGPRPNCGGIPLHSVDATLHIHASRYPESIAAKRHTHDLNNRVAYKSCATRGSCEKRRGGAVKQRRCWYRQLRHFEGRILPRCARAASTRSGACFTHHGARMARV